MLFSSGRKVLIVRCRSTSLERRAVFLREESLLFVFCCRSASLDRRAGGSNPQVTGRGSQVTGLGSRVTGHMLQVAGRRSQVASRRSQITGYQFNQSSLNYFFLFPWSARGKNKTCLLFKTCFSHIPLSRSNKQILLNSFVQHLKV